MEWLIRNSVYVQAVVAIIQALSAVLLAVLTAIYVVLTRKLSMENSQVLLKVDCISNPDLMGCHIKVKNYGPGHAVYVSVYAKMNSSTIIFGKYKQIRRKLKAKGPDILIAGEEVEYYINNLDYGVYSGMPIWVTYKNQSGKRYNYKWLHSIGGNSDDRLRLSDPVTAALFKSQSKSNFGINSRRKAGDGL